MEYSNNKSGNNFMIQFIMVHNPIKVLVSVLAGFFVYVYLLLDGITFAVIFNNNPIS